MQNPRFKKALTKASKAYNQHDIPDKFLGPDMSQPQPIIINHLSNGHPQTSETSTISNILHSFQTSST